ncbi:acyl-CoA dehydrogenase family protein [Streptomyces acidicola]|uniref:acyl-CoA dehydrogenase family protein n=1 Tax=Streptomyces acidicola TaxID=2596892 RepID=UPI00380806FE
MLAAVESARSSQQRAAKTPGCPYGRQASIAKLVATEAAMRVTTDAVQVFDGAGYTRDFPLERYMREAKVMQFLTSSAAARSLAAFSRASRRSAFGLVMSAPPHLEPMLRLSATVHLEAQFKLPEGGPRWNRQQSRLLPG